MERRGTQMVLCGEFDQMMLTFSNVRITIFYRLYINKFSIRLLNRSRDTILDIKESTEYDPGWIQNGGIFIARTKVSVAYLVEVYINENWCI